MGAWIETIADTGPQSTEYVAPFMGAWIETMRAISGVGAPKSHPSWVRGLKLQNEKNIVQDSVVAPFMGAWIETRLPQAVRDGAGRRTLHGCVD